MQTNDLKKKRVIAVIGVQRSGTSAITKGIQTLGVNLGEFYGSDITGADNEKGYFEDLEISALDIGMLNSIGYTWNNPVLPIFDDDTKHVLSAFNPVAVNIIERRLENTKLFGLKDPNIAKLLPFWNDIFGSLGIEPAYVIACRNPLSAAKSMQKRDGFDIVNGAYIWLGAVMASLIHSAGYNRIVVDYDELIKDPEKQLRRIAERFDLEFDGESSMFKDYKNYFLSESLRHTVFSIDHLAADDEIPPKITELYVLLKSIAADETSIDGAESAAKINKIYSWMTELRSTLLYMQAQFDALLQLKKESEEKGAKCP
ncbi:MAG: hypothetical protein M1276_03690 [Deltaproteobacteria bacterium]|nr:hypothetical protein [Deltaproteobacteria bacterium]